MNKSGRIVAVVAGITLANVLLCFWWPVPSVLSRSSFEWTSIALVYCVLVADGLLVSIALHGKQQLQRRVVTAYGAPLLVAAPFVGYIHLFLAIDRALRYAPEPNFGIEDLLLVLLFLLLLVAIFAGVLRTLWKRTRKRSVELDAAEWLWQRSLAENARQKRASRRALAVSLIIPFIAVLPTFLFMHELLAIRSHLVHPGPTEMGEYRMPVPWTWMVWWHDSENVYGSALRGTVRAGKSLYSLYLGRVYLVGRSSESEWYVRKEIPGRWYPHREPWYFRDYDLVETREIQFGGGTMRCVRYVPKRPFTDQPNFTDIECAGPQRLFAGFSGEPRDGELFYRVISQIEVVH